MPQYKVVDVYDYRLIVVTCIAVHDREVRERRKCSHCKKQRLTTRHTMAAESEGDTWDEYLCNDCMVTTCQR